MFDSILAEDMVDLRENLAALEDRLQYELHTLKLLIQNLMPSNNHQQHRQDYQKNYYNSNQNFNDRSFQTQQKHQRPIQPPPTVPRENNVRQDYLETSTVKFYRNITSSAKPITSSAKPITSSEKPIASSKTEEISIKTPELLTVRKNNLKSLETNKRRLVVTTQEPETTHKQPVTEPTKSEYTYYWKLDNFPKVFNHAKKNEVYSHVFNVKGLFLRIRAKQDFENTLIDIEHLANVENSEKLEVEISDGFVFKEIAEEKLFQYSFAVMDLNRPQHDLISPVYWNTDTDNFLVPNSLHLLANYVKNDNLLIKLIIKF